MLIVNLLGLPSINENGKNIFIPNGKVSAFLYYIFSKKNVSRDELAGIFWGNSSDEKARISLRNVLHKAKKLFKTDIILTPNKNTISLNMDIDIFLDIDEFEKEPEDKLDLYKGEFLKGFYLNDCIEFEYFVSNNRSYYEEMFIKTSLNSISKDLKENKTDKIEQKISNLLSVDCYNDESRLLLMQYYANKGRYDKVINEYYNFQKLLQEDLGTTPCIEIENFYKDAIRKVNDFQKSEKSKLCLFYNREYEMEILQGILDDFYTGKSAKSILLRGEIGIGKSTLKKEIIQKNKDKFYIFETTCYQIEKEFSFSPWMKIISEIDHEIRKEHYEMPVFWEDMIVKIFQGSSSHNLPIAKIVENKENFNIEIIYNILLTALKEISKHKKIIIVVEDIYYADEQSLNLIINLILHFGENMIFFLTISKEKKEKIENLIISLKSSQKLQILDLERFTKQDVSIITRKILGEDAVNAKEIAEIYEKSNGNALFLNEYINLYKNNKKEQLLTRKISDILENRFSFLDEEETNVLKIISVFYKEVDLDMLVKLSYMNAFTILKIINSLENKNIIEEYKLNNKTYIKFVHNLYKDYMYNTLTISEKQIMHNEIAKSFETEMISNNDLTYYINIKYHYELSGNEMKTLKYEVHILNYHLNYNHELFPNLDDNDLNKQVKLYIKNDKVIKWIKELENTILKLKNSMRNKSEKDEMDVIELMFLYCKGRYLIRGGIYGEGTRTMERVISLAKALNNKEMLIAGYKQMVIYGIQINDTSIMIKYIIPALKSCKQNNMIIDLGVFNRLYGLYHLMQGNVSQAEELFLKSIKIFSDSIRIESGNSISIAASYNYIGEIRKSEGKYEEAMSYFEKSIELCKESAVQCISIFYINAGKTLFLKNSFEESKKYFTMAKEIVVQFDSYWKDTLLDSFLSLFYFLEKECSKAMKYLNRAMHDIKTINNPSDIGMVYFVQTLIKLKMESLKEDFGDISSFLSEPSELYFYKALKYLDKYRDKSEIEYLKKIMQEEY